MIDNPLATGHFVERHEPGQSLLNYKFDRLQTFDILSFDRGYTEYSTPIETISLKKRTK